MQAVAVAGAIVSLIVFAASVQGVDVPGDVAAALTTLIAFASGYLRSGAQT